MTRFVPIFLFISILFFINQSKEQSNNHVGMNIDGVDYRSRTQPFVNLIRQAQPFWVPGSNQQKATVDSNGWPTEDFQVELQTLGVDLVGEYSIYCTGKATIASTGDGKITKQTFDPTTNTQEAILSITDEKATTITLQFTDTKNGVKDLAVLLPGFNQSQKNDFNPLMIEQLKGFSIIRFLSMTPVNRDFIKTWSERSTPQNSPSYSGFCCPLMRNDSSVPYEEIIRLANTLGADIWLNLPVSADDDFYVSLATLLKQNLDSKINIYYEFGNEMWNGGFPSEYYVKVLANDSVTKNGDPYKLDYDKTTNGNQWEARYVAYKAAVGLPALFEKVFSNDVGKNKRVRPLLGGQTSSARFIEDQLEYLRQTQPNGIKTLHGMHISMYFGLTRDDKNNNSLTGKEVLASLNETLNSNAPNLRNQHYLHAAVAAWYGLEEVLGYESGPSTFGGESIDGKVQANLAPEMQGMVENMYKYWHAYGFSTLNYFHAGANIYRWEFGQWAIQTSMHNSSTAKVKALQNVKSKPRPPSTIGFDVPLKNYSAGLYIGFYQSGNGPPVPHPINWVPVGSIYYYPLKASKAGEYELVLYTATSNSSYTKCQIEVGVSTEGMDQPDYDTVTLPPTKSHTDWAPTNPVKINVYETLTTLRLRIVDNKDCSHLAGGNDQLIANFEINSFDVVDPSL